MFTNRRLALKITHRRLSLSIPDSPIEQQTFRSRSFRRILAAGCCLLFFIVTLHSFALNDLLQRQAAEEAAKPQYRSKSGRVTIPRHDSQIPVKDPSDRQIENAEQVEELPEVIRIPFEEAVSSIQLQGWEDEWLAFGRFDTDNYGPLPEPKIDFVYNC